MADGSGGQRVLESLARMVGSMADATERDTQLLTDLADGEHTYLQLAEALLTRSDLPMANTAGVAALAAMGDHLDRVAAAVADGQKARAGELDAVRKKEEEEKDSGGGGRPGGGEDTSGSGDGSTGENVENVDDDTRVRDGDEEIDEIDPPDGSRTDGSRTGGGMPPPGGGTVVDPPAGGAPGDGSVAHPPADGEPGDGSEVGPPEPKTPVPPIGETTVTVKEKRTRRCFEFTLRNATSKPVSDLHFDGDDLSMTSTSVGRKGGLQGWKPFNVRGGKGLLFKVEDGKPNIPPGGRTASFEFCTESSPRGFEIRLSHPDGTFTPLGPGSVTVRGRPARQRNGRTLLPPQSVETVYDLEVEVTKPGQNLDIRSSGDLGRDVEVDGARADAYTSNDDPKRLQIAPIPSNRPFRVGEKIKVTVSSTSSSARFRDRPRQR